MLRAKCQFESFQYPGFILCVGIAGSCGNSENCHILFSTVATPHLTNRAHTSVRIPPDLFLTLVIFFPNNLIDSGISMFISVSQHRGSSPGLCKYSNTKLYPWPPGRRCSRSQCRKPGDVLRTHRAHLWLNTRGGATKGFWE